MGLVSSCKGVNLDMVIDTCRRKMVTLEAKEHRAIQSWKRHGKKAFLLKASEGERLCGYCDFGLLACRSVRQMSVVPRHCISYCLVMAAAENKAHNSERVHDLKHLEPLYGSRGGSQTVGGCLLSSHV